MFLIDGSFFFYFNYTMKRRENLICYHTLLMSPNVLYIFSSPVCYLHSSHDMSNKKRTFYNFCC